MKIIIENLGPLSKVELEPGDLTIVCGSNNTGKTYATYGYYGFLCYWHEYYALNMAHIPMGDLFKDGTLEIKIDDALPILQKYIDAACSEYQQQLGNVFASQQSKFEKTRFSIEIAENDIRPISTYEANIGSPQRQLLSISVKNRIVCVTLLHSSGGKETISQSNARRILGVHMKNILFYNTFPTPFIASAERTGVAIFRKDLNLARNRLYDYAGKTGKTTIDIRELIFKLKSDYARPVEDDVKFSQNLESLVKSDSFIYEKHAPLLSEFSDIIGGDYSVTKNDTVVYRPRNVRGQKFSMVESSSALRSLLDVWFYLRHAAKVGDIFIIDEPELNLHPDNQRRVARLFAQLVNLGIKVFITTHSDYIVKEFSNLIMLRNDSPHIRKIIKVHKYKEEELLRAESVHVFIAKQISEPPRRVTRKKKDGKVSQGNISHRPLGNTLQREEVSAVFGIDAPSFNKAIIEINSVEQEIIRSRYEHG